LDNSFDFVYETFLGTSPKNNWINKYKLRGWTRSRHNTVNPVNKFIGMWVYIEVCGWEELSASATTGNSIPQSRTLTVEKGSSRT